MQDEPRPEEILAAIAAFLRGAPADPERQAFQTRVAAGALDLARRHLERAPAGEAAEADRLKALLGRDGSLEALNAELSLRLREGALSLSSAAAREHLWAVTLDKLAVDQPNYATYRAVLEKRGG